MVQGISPWRRPRLFGAALIGLLLGYALLRLPLLDSMPPFIDEAIHIHWARADLTGGTADGKWLSIAALAVAVRGLPLDPLIAARLVSVIAGAGVMLLAVWLGARLYSRRVGVLAGAVYGLLPFALLYDRMALTDGMMALLGGLSFPPALLLIDAGAGRRVRLWSTLGLILALTAALLAKVSAVVVVAVPLLAALLLPTGKDRRAAVRRVLPPVIAGAALFAGLVGIGFGAWQLANKTAGPSDALGMMALAAENARLALAWAWAMLTPPGALLLAGTMGWAAWRGGRAGRFLLLVIAAFVLPYIARAGIWYPRYLVPALLPAAVLLAAGIDAVGRALADRWGRPAVIVGLALLMAWPAAVDALLITQPVNAPLPDAAFDQFFAAPSSGMGLAELADFLRVHAAAEDGLTVARFVPSDHAWVGLDLVLAPSERLALVEWSVAADPADNLARVDDSQPVYLVLNPPTEAGHLAGVGRSLAADYLAGAELIAAFPRPGGESGLEVWRLR